MCYGIFWGMRRGTLRILAEMNVLRWGPMSTIDMVKIELIKAWATLILWTCWVDLDPTKIQDGMDHPSIAQKFTCPTTFFRQY